ncbi:MAG: hypothetical protein ACOC2W_03715 [bacterium]
MINSLLFANLWYAIGYWSIKLLFKKLLKNYNFNIEDKVFIYFISLGGVFTSIAVIFILITNYIFDVFDNIKIDDRDYKIYSNDLKDYL